MVKPTTSSAKKDITIIVFMMVFIFIASIQFHFNEHLREFLNDYNRFYAGELVFTFLILIVFFAVFSYRRWHETVVQTRHFLESEKARKEIELRSQALLTTIPNLTFRVKRDGTYLDFQVGNVNDLFAPVEDIIGSKISDRLPKDIADLFYSHIERALNFNSPQSFEYTLQIKDKPRKHQARMISTGDDEVFVLIRNVTDTEAITEALAESETRFRAVLESLSEGLVLTDLQDNILYMNQRMTDLCGWTIEEVKGKPAYSFFIPPEDVHKHHQRNTNREQGIAERYETEMVRKNGTRFWAEIYGSPFRDTSTHIVGTIGTIIDITERQWNERLQTALYRITAVSRSSEDTQQLFKNIHEIISDLMYAKNFYIALYDPVNSMISFPYFVDEVDPPPPPRKFSHGSTEFILETGNILHAPQPVFDEMSERGELNPIGAPAIDWLGVPLVYEDKPFGVLTIQSYDPAIVFGDREKEILVFVAQHISTIIRQKFEEERFKAIWEHSTDGMRVSDKNGMIVMVNEAYCKMVKKSKLEMIGKSINIVYDQEIIEAQAGEELYKERFSSSSINPRSESQIYLWSKETLFVEIDSLYITVGINERMLLSIFRDITERKKLEDQLLHAQKMDSIGVLAGGIAHDFNNVLAMILGSAELVIQKAKEYPDILRFARMIASAAERGSGIAKQLLLFARTEKGFLRPISISKVVTDVCQLLEHSIPKSITLEIHIFSQSDVVMGDEDQLHQVIINLAVNARDAIEQQASSTGLLTFTVKDQDGETLHRQFPNTPNLRYVALEVSDNGNGMDEQTVQRVFEPFFSTKTRGKGTGLGLSIVHGIMKSHHGIIDVKSTVGKGTTFLLFFPAINQTEETPVTINSGNGTKEISN